jgi:hypothetical protein
MRVADAAINRIHVEDGNRPGVGLPSEARRRDGYLMGARRDLPQFHRRHLAGSDAVDRNVRAIRKRRDQQFVAVVLSVSRESQEPDEKRGGEEVPDTTNAFRQEQRL